MRNQWIKATLFALAGIVALCLAFGADAMNSRVAADGGMSATKTSPIKSPARAGCTANPF